MKAREVNLEGEFDRNQVVGFLEDLVYGLKTGQVFLQREGKALILSPADAMKLTLHAADDESNEFFRLEMAWNKSVATVA